jgi:hypothetical protein
MFKRVERIVRFQVQILVAQVAQQTFQSAGKHQFKLYASASQRIDDNVVDAGGAFQKALGVNPVTEASEIIENGYFIAGLADGSALLLKFGN